MIIDQLKDCSRYFALHPRFQRAFQFLQNAEYESLEDGRIELEGKDLIAIVESGQGRTRTHAPLEAHRRYIDIQFTRSGFEEIGWKPQRDCLSIKQPYHPEKDIEFFHDTPLIWLPVPVNAFTIFFPEDAHAPLAGTSPVRKVIMKVAI